MKLKDFSATKLFSKQFETIFGKEATFGDIAKVQKNSNVNFLGNHVESFVKEKTNARKEVVPTLLPKDIAIIA